MNRREFMKVTLGAGLAHAFFPFGSLVAGDKARAKAAILLWLQGGPSQLDTFDPKPGTATGGPFKAIETASRFSISEHLPRLARSKAWSLVRSLHSKDPNHDTARYLLHTGYRVDATVEHPHLGSIVSKTLGAPGNGLPGCVSLGGDGAIGSGYLEADLAPLLIEKIDSPLEDLELPVGVTRFRLDDREALLEAQNEEFARRHRGDPRVAAHRQAGKRAFELVRSRRVRALDVSEEPDEVRRLYGDGSFGKACLMARRLVEAGVRFVEVSLADWDTHADNFNRTKALSKQLDEGMSGLLEDLARSGRLSETLVVCMGEFGRTPRVNAANGRDHFTRAFCAALAGGGIEGGRVVGATNELGTEIKDRPVSVADLFATIYDRLGVDPRREHKTATGRPMKVLDGGAPVTELLA